MHPVWVCWCGTEANAFGNCPLNHDPKSRRPTDRSGPVQHAGLPRTAKKPKRKAKA